MSILPTTHPLSASMEHQQESYTLTTLPLELLQKIIRFIPETSELKLVSQYFKRAVEDLSTTVKVHKTASRVMIANMMGGMQKEHVKELIFASSAASSLCFDSLAKQLPTVCKVKMHASIFTAKGGTLPWHPLQSLSVVGSGMLSMQKMGSIASYTALTNLSLTNFSALTDDFLQKLAPLQGLQSLDLSYCCRISGSGFASLTPMPYLIRIDLEGCYALDDACFFYLQRFSALEDLNIESCNAVTGEGFSYLTALSRLKSFRIGNIASLMPRAFLSLAKIPALEYLDVTAAAIDDHALVALGMSERLRKVNLTACLGLSGAAIAQLCSSCQVEDLNLCWQVTLQDHDLNQLSSCQSLKKLTLYGCCGLSSSAILNLSRALRIGTIYH